MSHPLRACQDCGGEGGFYTPEDPRYWRLGREYLEQWDPCPSCAGSGWEEGEPEPIEQDELPPARGGDA